jgi:hypothetical protein
MDLFGSTRRIFATAILAGAMTTTAGSQTNSTDNREPKTAPEIAKAIAATVAASAIKTPGAPIAFDSALSHDNVVEMRYVANDLAAFSRLKGSAEETRLTKAYYYCNESRVTYLNQGVVMHEVVATSDHTDQIDFTFDKSVCDSLPRPALADPAKLAELALSAAKAESESPDATAANPLFRMDGATAHEGVVEERHIVTDAQAKPRVQASRNTIVAISTGYFCDKYREVILQGLAFHHVFVLPDGSSVIDFTINKSSC